MKLRSLVRQLVHQQLLAAKKRETLTLSRQLDA